MRLFLNFDDTYGRIYLQTQNLFRAYAKMQPPIKELELFCTLMLPGKPKSGDTVTLRKEGKEILFKEESTTKCYELADLDIDEMKQDYRMGEVRTYETLRQVW